MWTNPKRGYNLLPEPSPFSLPILRLIWASSLPKSIANKTSPILRLGTWKLRQGRLEKWCSQLSSPQALRLTLSSGRYILPTRFNFKIQCNHWKLRAICSLSYTQFSSAVSGGYSLGQSFTTFSSFSLADPFSGEMVFLMVCGHLPVFRGIVWAPSPAVRISLPSETCRQSRISHFSWLLSSLRCRRSDPFCLSSTVQYGKINMTMQQCTQIQGPDPQRVPHRKCNYS